MVMEDCLGYAEELSSIIADTARSHGCDCILFSGGVDTSFIAVSLSLRGVKFHAITVVFPGVSFDEEYSRALAGKLGFSHEVVRGLTSGVEDCLRVVISALRTIDPIEVVCDIPVCMGLKHALKHGCRCVLTGDGGDELFLGYDFLLNLPVEELKTWLKEVMRKQGFSAERIGEHLGLRVISGFFTEEVKAFSEKVPLECRVNSYGGRVWGKFLLRIFLARHGIGEIAWRKKTPINIGSGSNSLLYEWSRKVSVEEVVELAHSSNIYFPSHAHAYLYKKLLEYGLELPSMCNDSDSVCPICGRCISRGHCSFCGASLRGEFQVNVYSDDELLFEKLFGYAR